MRLFLIPVASSPLVFLASLIATVSVACLVVCSQALRTTRAQPTEVLRYE